MRVAQVVTLLSSRGAFGGPSTVAIEQCTALAALGHDVTLFGAVDSRSGARPSEFGSDFEFAGFPAIAMLPRGRLVGSASPSLHRALRARLSDYDIVHVHLGRDLTSLPAARLAVSAVATVVQTHGMVMPDVRLSVRGVDQLVMRHVLARARAVCYLTAQERAGLSLVSRGRARLRYLRNGIQEPTTRRRSAPAAPFRVCFCARLHPRKRVQAFLEMAQLLSRTSTDFEFVVAGADEGSLAQVTALLAVNPHLPIRYVGALDGTRARALLAESDVFVLPSVDEPFPMTLLEALAAGTPSVVTDTCGIATELAERGAVVVTDGSPERLAAGVKGLCSTKDVWQHSSDAGVEVVSTRFSAAAVAETLIEIYRAGV